VRPRLVEALRAHDIDVFSGTSQRAVGGGDISAAWRLETGSGPLFLKTGSSEFAEMFDAEAEGLEELRRAGAIRTPVVLACGCAGNESFLALEWIEFDQGQRSTERTLGRQLAALHRHTSERFGWHRDNTIGATPQHNRLSENWIDFFREQRLLFQIELAATNGYNDELQAQGANLARNLGRLFEGYEPVPSLLHGDLWGGNWAACGGEPVLFDPAVYYGDRESDIAMTQLFGGFHADFHAAYAECWPLADGYQQRLPLYQLYHVLNHLNLFGRGYLGRSMELLGALNRDIQAL
jgi:fructosamine-3-kinase